MKIALVGVADVPLGKHKVKDPRLDKADKLVKADTKTYARSMSSATRRHRPPMHWSFRRRADSTYRERLEFAETRLERNPPAAEKAVLEKIKARLEGEGLVAEAGLTPEDCGSSSHTRSSRQNR